MTQAILEKPPAKQADLIVEEAPRPRPEVPMRLRALAPGKQALFTDFSVVLIEANRLRSGWRFWRIAFSLVAHILAVALLVLSGLLFADSLDLRAYTATFLAAPPPPPAPPPPAAAPLKAAAKMPRRVLSAGGKLVVPTVIPKEVAMLHEDPLPPDAGVEGVIGGVPGGVPGGQLGGVVGGILGGVLSGPPKLNVAAAQPKKILRVGGRVRPPRAITKTEPKYPTLAKQARIQGDVILDAVLDTDGRVVDVRVVSGHPLLIQAAMDCVKEWLFEPTYLNDQPFQIEMNITISFRME